ncbi:MAG: mechanosensitive ion channel [Planctomycetota bacterium]|nr:mechanosensitive ion channel [Planctomycetota bacterium]
MFRKLLIAVIALLFVSTPLASGQMGMLTALQDHGRQIETHPAPSTPSVAPATQPTTQPAVTTTHEGKDLGEIDLIKVIKGEKALTVEQIFQLGYWVDFGKDFLFGVFSLIPKLFAAVFLFGIFWVIYRFVRRIVVGGMARAGVDPSIRDMLSSLLKWTILGFGLVIAGNQIGIQIAALLTGVSIIGLAVGFAAQETLSNFIAGVVIFWDKPFKVGDWIEMGDTFAQVQRVTFRSTRLLNGDGEVIIYPNTTMLSSKLSNHTTNPKNRVTVEIGIAYKESIDNARQVLLGLVADDARICPDPKPVVVVKACADSSVNLLLRFWIEDESIEFLILYEYLEKAKNALDAAGIQIPFPHMQLFLEQTPATNALAHAPAPGPVMGARLSA